jgi:hypothetical protein
MYDAVSEDRVGRDVTKCDDRPTQVPFVVQNGAAMIDLALEPFQFPGQQLFCWSVKEREVAVAGLAINLV